MRGNGRRDSRQTCSSGSLVSSNTPFRGYSSYNPPSSFSLFLPRYASFGLKSVSRIPKRPGQRPADPLPRRRPGHHLARHDLRLPLHLRRGRQLDHGEGGRRGSLEPAVEPAVRRPARRHGLLVRQPHDGGVRPAHRDDGAVRWGDERHGGPDHAGWADCDGVAEDDDECCQDHVGVFAGLGE